MRITRTSLLSGITHTREIAITEEQIARWEAGEFIQEVAHDLSPEDREFIMTGITPEEWDTEFGKDEE
jgi:hypothetical protein